MFALNDRDFQIYLQKYCDWLINIIIITYNYFLSMSEGQLISI